MEVEITAMVCKTRARTYEVPISYYGRTYEEGKKIGLWDGVKALYYIVYYNLVQPWLPAGRAYIREVDCFLESRAPSWTNAGTGTEERHGAVVPDTHPQCQMK